jgi:hypothetical protein
VGLSVQNRQLAWERRQPIGPASLKTLTTGSCVANGGVSERLSGGFVHVQPSFTYAHQTFSTATLDGFASIDGWTYTPLHAPTHLKLEVTPPPSVGSGDGGEQNVHRA